MADFYALLNVQTNATPEQIKEAFKSISIFHPDKMQSASHKSLKERNQYESHKVSFHEEWVRINRAKTVLTDPILRSIYDEFGVEGLEFAEQTILKQRGRSAHTPSSSSSSSRSATTEVGFRTPASIRVMQNVRDALQTRNQNELVARLSASSSVQMDVNLEHLFDSNFFPALSDSFLSSLSSLPSLPSPSSWSSSDSFASFSSLLDSLDVPQLVMQTAVGGRMTERDQCTLSCYVVTRDGLGFGDLALNWRRVWQPGIMWTTANVAGPFSKSLACEVTRVLDSKTGHQVSLGASVRRGETGLSLSTSRQISTNLTATIGWKVGQEGGISFAVGHTNDANRSSTNCEVYARDMETGGNVGVRVTYKKVLHDKTSTVRTGFKRKLYPCMCVYCSWWW